MSISFQPASILFDPTRGQTQSESTTVVFNAPVKHAEATLKGFNIKFSNGDRPFWQERIQTSTRCDRNAVNVTVDFLLRDASGNIDDPFEGWIDVLVMAELDDEAAFRPIKQRPVSALS